MGTLPAPLARQEGEPLGPGGDRLLDPDWPAGIDALGDRAPVALWAKGDTALLTAPVWDRITVTGARASTGYGEHVTTELVQSAVADSRVVFSGGAAKGADAVFDDARAIRDGGGNGSIIGRNSFQRSREDALEMLGKLVDIYLGKA